MDTMETLGDQINFAWEEKYPLEDTLLGGIGLNKSQVLQLMTKFENPIGERAHRDRALLYVLLRTVLGASEVILLRWSGSVQNDEGETFFMIPGKKGHIRYASPGREALGFVQAYQDFCGVSDLLFLSLPDRATNNLRHQLTSRGLRKIISGWKRISN